LRQLELCRRQDPESAIDYLRKAVEVDPRCTDALLRLGNLQHGYFHDHVNAEATCAAQPRCRESWQKWACAPA
jgi:hypothetical protein